MRTGNRGRKRQCEKREMAMERRAHLDELALEQREQVARLQGHLEAALAPAHALRQAAVQQKQVLQAHLGEGGGDMGEMGKGGPSREGGAVA